MVLYILTLSMIIIFIFLIFYNIILHYNIYKVSEGFSDNSGTQYKDYPPNALILAEQNAGNIEYLKSQMDQLSDLNQTVVDLSNNYVDLYNQVQGLAQQQAQYGAELNGGSTQPITVTGTDLSTTTPDETTDTTAVDEEDETTSINGIDTSTTTNTATAVS
jgi:TolA-binding protein